MKNNVLVTALWLFLVSNLPAAVWQGEWITAPQADKPDQWYCFRTTVDLSSKPQSALANIACDSKYWLWINDQLAVFEGQLKRGPTPQDTYYDEVDLANYLKEGRNMIALLVWYWGRHGFSHNSSGRAGLFFQVDIDGRVLLSDSNWKVRVHPAYGVTEKPLPNFRLSESNILFDAQKDIPGWHTSAFDDSAWNNAVPCGRPPVQPWGNLEKRPILQWKDNGITLYVQTKIVNNDDGTKTIVGKLPYNCHITPYLKVNAPAGLKIDIRTDNYKGGSLPNVRAVYITKDGTQEYESLGWMNGHEVRYTMPADVDIVKVGYRETGYNAEFVGMFRSNDERLNALWEKSKRTLYVTMRDNYMDCPDRERAQWWGDLVNEMGEAFYVFDARKGPLLARKGIYELARWQRADKVLYSPVPAGIPAPDNLDMKNPDGTWARELPPQSLASVGWYGFWTYYSYTSDRQTIVDVYPHVRDYLSLWQLGADGLIIHRAGGWDWADWGENIDVAVLDNAWVYLAMKAAVEMATLSDCEQDIAAYERLMRSIKENFNKTFWNGRAYRSPDYKGETDDRAQAMAVVAGLAQPEFYPMIKQTLQTQLHASPYMEKYVLESLYLMDAPEQSIERMKKRYADQIDSPVTTLWEGWGFSGTYNHAWSGGPLTVLSQYGAGIAPTEPGFKAFAVLPQMGGLEEIESVVPTQYGSIRLNLKQKKQFEMDLRVPKGTTAVIGIPNKTAPSQIRINGQVVYKEGKSAADNYLGTDDRWIKYRVEEGNWTIRAE